MSHRQRRCAARCTRSHSVAGWSRSLVTPLCSARSSAVEVRASLEDMHAGQSGSAGLVVGSVSDEDIHARIKGLIELQQPTPVFALDEHGASLRNTPTFLEVERISLRFPKARHRVPAPPSRPLRVRPRRAARHGRVDRARRAFPGHHRRGPREQRWQAPSSPPGWRAAMRHYGVIAFVERLGRFSGGSPAAVLKAERRGRIGTGVSGPGAALSGRGRADRRPRHRACPRARRRVQGTGRRRAPAARGLAGHRHGAPDDRPGREIADAAGYAPYLSVDRKRGSCWRRRTWRCGWRP